MTTAPRLVVSRALVCAIAACAVIAGASPASAQMDIELVRGPRAPGLVITPQVSMGVLFDDNVTVAGEGNPKTNDTVLRASPGLELTFTKKHTVFEMGYAGTLDRYSTLDVYDSYDQKGRVEFRHQPSRRVQLYARDGFSVNPTTEGALAADVPFLRTGTRQNTFATGTIIAVTQRFDFSASYQSQWLDFDRVSQPVDALLQGGQAHTVQVGGRQRIAEHVSVGVDYAIQHAIIHGGADTSDIQNVEAVIGWQASETVQVEGGVGVSHLSASDPLGSRTGPAGHVSVVKRTEHAMFNVGAARSFRPSFGSTRSTQNQQVNAGVFMPIVARRIYVQGQVIWHRNQPAAGEGLTRTALSLRATTGYAMSRWLRIEGFYDRAVQETSVAGGLVHRNRIGVQLSTSAPMRID